MSESVIAALIGLAGSIVVALFTYLGVKNTNRAANDSMRNEMVTQQALFGQKLDNLTEEVREHNNFARRLPVVEQKLDDIDVRVSKLENKIDNQ